MKKSLKIILPLILVCVLIGAIVLWMLNTDNPTETPGETTGNVANTTDEVHTHVFGAWDVVQDATCTENGAKERTCSCGEVERESIPATGHAAVVDPAVSSTCTVEGKTEGSHCSACGAVITAQNLLPLIEHTYDDDKDTSCNVCGFVRLVTCRHTRTEALPAVAATCTASGLTEGKKCSDCGVVLTEQSAVPPTDHTPTVVKGYDATCTKTGLTDGKKCSVCGRELETAVTIPMKPHQYANDADTTCDKCGFVRDVACAHKNTTAIPGKAATCTEAGLTEGKKCTACGEILTEQTLISKLGHVEVIDSAVPATCTAGGKTEGKHCSRCSEVLISQTDTPALGHVEVIDSAVPATCTAGGKTEGKHCSRCSDVLISQTDTPALGHDYVNNVCTRCGDSLKQTSEGLKYTKYTLNNKVSYSVTGMGTCADTDVVIPSTYNGLPVTSIGYSAFSYCTGLTSIEIPNSVTSIGDWAFYECISLTSIEIPNSVTSIGEKAFEYCTGLTSIEIPNSVTSIGDSAFSGCFGLTRIEIPNSVLSIGEYAFSDCSRLTSIEIPNSVMSIGDSAFSGCFGLTRIEIPNSVTSIGNAAFYGCTGLTSVTIGNSVTSIGYSAFGACTGLTSVTFKNPTRWYIAGSPYATSGTSVDLSDPAAAALYLRLTYSSYYWKRA